MALVREVIFVFTLFGSMFMLRGSTSARTGVAPAWMMALTEAQKVNGVVMTSSPGLIPAARMLRCKAAVQELTATACSASLYAAKRRSNSATRGPVPIQPLRRQDTTSSISSSVIRGDPKTRNFSRMMFSRDKPPIPGVDGGAINLYSIPIQETAKGYRNAHDMARRTHAREIHHALCIKHMYSL